MKKQDFYFELPEEQIAQYPLDKRSESRMLYYDKKTEQHQHTNFKDLIHFLNPGDLLVFNDSKVLKARLFGKKTTGGAIECLVERIVNETRFLAHIKASKALKPGNKVNLEANWFFEMLERKEDLFLCEANGPVKEMLEAIGHIPLPLYISRRDEQSDKSRYQTVYAKNEGSIAAPTAGLHFDEEILNLLEKKGIEKAYVTLHVGAGTFRPVRSEKIEDHKMHSEYFEVSAVLCEKIKKTKAAGGRVIAVGTTALRSLESAAASGTIEPSNRDTSIFIYPGYTFKICDGLITNFHLPESTLLMLVSAFIGHKQTMALYQEAISNKYRFYSYGDVSLLL